MWAPWISLLLLVPAWAILFGGLRGVVLFPVIAVAGVAAGVLVFSRFELFVVSILAARASLDTLGVATHKALDPAGVLSAVFLVAGTVWLLTQHTAEKVPRTPLARPLIGLTVAGGLSIAGSSDPTGSIQDVVRLTTLVMIVLVLNQLLVSTHRLRLLLAALFASSLVPFTVGAYQLATSSGFHISAGFNRVQATFAHPNPFAMYLTMLIVTGVAILPYLSRGWKISLAILVGVAGVFLLLTYTRSAWIATAAGLLVVGLCHGKRVLGVVGLALVVIVFSVPSIAARFQDLETSATSSGAPANSLVWRLEYWEQTLELSDSPIFGEGLGGVRAQTDVEKEPHNDFIRIYVETGLVGLFAYVWFLLTMAGVGRRGLRSEAGGLHRGVIVGFLGSFVAFLLLSLVSNVITQLVILWYFAALGSAAVAAPRLARESDTVPA